MATIQELVKNKKLQYPDLCQAILDKFGVEKSLNWDSILPPQQQKDLFGGETLRIVSDHPTLTNQKDIRPIVHLTGNTSQLLFFYVQLKDEKLPKVDVERITRKFIGGHTAERYIIWFFGNKSLNTLKVVISGKEGKKIVLKTLAFESGQWYKTYDFILNKVSEQFNTDGLFQKEKEPALLWKALWTAFDISIVNKKFYLEIKHVFDALVKENLSKAKGILTTDAERSQFAVRLIGRIIFCWFLKKKGIIQDDVLSSSAVKSNKQYYHSLLESLFFDVFNTPLQQRKKNIPKLIVDYPFLNGGLFDDQPTDHRNDYRLVIDDEWFEIFFNQTLERYNFTVDENSSSSSEIAIDPEMLGRIFENLLAEQNPETGESARKATGSFYTPREIVEYMVEESLIAYLCSEIGVDEHSTEGIAPDEQLTLAPIKKQPPVQLGIAMKNAPKRDDVLDFVHTYAINEGLIPYKESLGKALHNIKVLDPACGSGAFPMGVLQKLVGLKHTLNDKKDLYDVKLTTIQNSIYGVDIQPMATELSRLRCWLSLIVDEDPKDIKPLPNLDFKFVTANSLIDLGYDKFLERIEGIKRGLGEDAKIPAFEMLLEKVFVMETLKKDYFQAGIKEKQKETIKKDFKNIQIEIFDTTTRLRKSYPEITNFLDNLVKWEPFDETQVSPFFSKSWMFGVNSGFDIVIANPPYVSHDKILDKKYLKTHYDTYEPFADLYCYFFEMGCRNLNTSGQLCFITSNSYLKAEYGFPLRTFLSSKTNVLQIVNIEDFQLFESAIVNTAILIVKNKFNDIRHLVRVINHSYDGKLSFYEYVEQNTYWYDRNDLNNKGWTLIEPNKLLIQKKIEAAGKTLEQLHTKIRLGIATGDNNAFVIDDSIKHKLISTDSHNEEIIKPILRGRDINRYEYSAPKSYILLTKNGIDVKKKYPSIYDYLESFGDSFKNRGAKGRHWSNLRACSFFDDFKLEKIIWIELTDHGRFALCKDEVYLLNSAYFLLSPNGLLSKYLLGILNSKIIEFYISCFAETSGMGTLRWINNYVKDFPIPVIDEKRQNVIVKLVDLILQKKISSSDTTDIENEIDVMACKLYNLKYNEVKIFDPTFALNEEEYEKVVV